MAGQVGPALAATGTSPSNAPRLCKTTEAAVQQTHGKYYEACSNGSLFSACEQGTGIAPAQTISTTALLALYNPKGSGVRLAIKKVSLGYISGTLSSGTIYHAVDPTATQAAPSGGTALTAICNDIGNGKLPAGLARVNATVAATVVAYRPFVSDFPELASTANAFQPVTEDLDGEIVVEPGCSYQLQCIQAGAGTSPKVTMAVVWEEIPIVS